MASTGFLADFSRRPAGVKIGVFFLILAVLGGLWYELFYAKVLKDIDHAKQTAKDLNSRSAKLDKDEVTYKELDEQQKKLKQLIADNDNALPTAGQLPAFFEMLNRKVGEAGVEVRKWDYQKEAPIDETIYKVPVQIEMQGTFYQIEKFFYLLYKMNQKEGDEGSGDTPVPVAVDNLERDRIVTVEDLHIYDPVVKNGELELTATFRASTFRKEEPPPPAPDAKDKKKTDKAKPGAAAPAGGGGLTGMPAKAKAKTEDAMQKDETRANGSGTDDAAGADRVKGGM